jgi:hypothetical protein
VIAALAWRFAVPASRRLGFGAVERLAVTVSFRQRSETDEDANTRTWKTLRWQSASGEFEETVHGQKALEALAARGPRYAVSSFACAATDACRCSASRPTCERSHRAGARPGVRSDRGHGGITPDL